MWDQKLRPYHRGAFSMLGRFFPLLWPRQSLLDQAQCAGRHFAAATSLLLVPDRPDRAADRDEAVGYRETTPWRFLLLDEKVSGPSSDGRIERTADSTVIDDSLYPLFVERDRRLN